MFLQVSVAQRGGRLYCRVFCVPGGLGMCVAGWHAWQGVGDVHCRGHARQGHLCMAGVNAGETAIDAGGMHPT